MRTCESVFVSLTRSFIEAHIIVHYGQSGNDSVKTQNKLRPEHIQKIVETYRNRTEIEKYSHLATLQEIKENDYNLNIPRYVDTFEEEEEIEISLVEEDEE